jgi:hypothetical protein
VATVVGMGFQLQLRLIQLSVLLSFNSSFVKRRNDKVIQAAARSNAIVSSLFPSNIRDRLFKAEDDKAKDLQWKVPKGGLKSYLRDDGDGATGISDNKSINTSKPLADLFPETTIMVSH